MKLQAETFKCLDQAIAKCLELGCDHGEAYLTAPNLPPSYYFEDRTKDRNVMLLWSHAGWTVEGWEDGSGGGIEIAHHSPEWVAAYLWVQVQLKRVYAPSNTRMQVTEICPFMDWEKHKHFFSIPDDPETMRGWLCGAHQRLNWYCTAANRVARKLPRIDSIPQIRLVRTEPHPVPGREYIAGEEVLAVGAYFDCWSDQCIAACQAELRRQAAEYQDCNISGTFKLVKTVVNPHHLITEAKYGKN